MITPPRSPETDALVEALRIVSLGEAVSYAALADAAGLSLGALHDRMTSARKIAQRDHGAVFQTLRGSGLRRLAPDEAPAIGHAARGDIRRRAARAQTSIVKLAESGNGQSAEAALETNRVLGVLGAIRAVTSDRAMKRIAAIPPAEAAAPTQAQLAGRLLAAFTKPAPKPSQEP